ncbi:MAG: glycosyltransferase family 4 protein [Elusimicrobiales bacterium]|nr:glycosyltransferase family 4 protein [Elusimicrobiales bacterium]
MKICLLSTSTPAHRHGGTETHCWNLAKRAAALGNDVTLLTTALSGRPGVETSNGLQVHYLEGTDAAMSRAWAAKWWKASADKIRDLSSRDRPDIIWAEGTSGLGYASTARRELGIPLLSVMQGFGLRGEISSAWRDIDSLRSFLGFAGLYPWRFFFSYLPWSYKTMRGSDRIVAVSDESAAETRKEFPLFADKVRTVYNGIDTSVFRPDRDDGAAARARLGISPERRVILMSGTATRQKGFREGMAAFAALGPAPEPLLVIAGDGPELPVLKRRAKELGISSRVLFTGAVSNQSMPALYNSADVYLNPTLRAEGFGIVVAEAMACGKPCVVSFSGGTGSTITGGESGFFVPPGGIREMTEKMSLLLKDGELAERFAAAARARALEKFDLKKTTEAYISISLEVLKGGKKK